MRKNIEIIIFFYLNLFFFFQILVRDNPYQDWNFFSLLPLPRFLVSNNPITSIWLLVFIFKQISIFYSKKEFSVNFFQQRMYLFGAILLNNVAFVLMAYYDGIWESMHKNDIIHIALIMQCIFYFLLPITVILISLSCIMNLKKQPNSA